MSFTSAQHNTAFERKCSTAIDVLCDETLRANARAEFDAMQAG